MQTSMPPTLPSGSLAPPPLGNGSNRWILVTIIAAILLFLILLIVALVAVSSTSDVATAANKGEAGDGSPMVNAEVPADLNGKAESAPELASNSASNSTQTDQDASQSEQTAEKSDSSVSEVNEEKSGSEEIGDEETNAGTVGDLSEKPTLANESGPLRIAIGSLSSGNAFEDVSNRLKREGAKTGDVQISLAWNNLNDLDLHVLTPSKEVIDFSKKRSRCRGQLDVDMNVAPGESNRPVENIFWPKGSAPSGNFQVFVNHYSNNGSADPTEYVIVVKVGSSIEQFTGQISSGNEIQFVCEFERE